MKKALYNSSLVIGFLLLLGGLLLYGLHRFEIVNVGNAKLPSVVIIFGMGLLVAGACELFTKASKKMRIETQDERNVLIGKTAKAFAYDVITLLLAITMVMMMLFDLISYGAFLVLFGVYVVSQIAFIFRLWHLQKQM